MANSETVSDKYDKSFFGHPGGLSTLFFTEMWERFSYYGMRALLVLYMVAAVKDGGLGFSTPDATAIYGLYTASVYFLPLIGGWLADRFIGAKRATLIGGIIIAARTFTLAVPSLTFFYLGLVLVALGTGFLKSNISAMVGDLYDADDERRDGGFSIFYMGINLGAFAAPLITGALAAYNWHWGFAAAGVGMVAGLIQYVLGAKKLEGVGEPRLKANLDASAVTPTYLIQVGAVIAVAVAILLYVYSAYGMNTALKVALIPILVVGGLIVVIFTGMQDKLTITDWKRIGIIIILFLFASLFWAGFEQAGSSFSLFAEQLTRQNIRNVGNADSLVSINQLDFYHHNGSDFRNYVGKMGQKTAERCFQIRARFVLSRARFCCNDLCFRFNRRRQSQPDVARCGLFSAYLRRTFPESGRVEFDDQTRARKNGWADARRVVSGIIARKFRGG